MQQQFKRQLMALGVLVEDVIASFCRGAIEVCNYGTMGLQPRVGATTLPGSTVAAQPTAGQTGRQTNDAILYCLGFRFTLHAAEVASLRVITIILAAAKLANFFFVIAL